MAGGNIRGSATTNGAKMLMTPDLEVQSLFTKEFRVDPPWRLNILEAQIGQIDRIFYRDANPFSNKVDDQKGLLSDMVIQTFMFLRACDLSFLETFNTGVEKYAKRLGISIPERIQEIARTDIIKYMEEVTKLISDEEERRLPQVGGTLNEFCLTLSRRTFKAIGELDPAPPSQAAAAEAMINAFVLVRFKGFTIKELYEHGYARINEGVYKTTPDLERAKSVSARIEGLITSGRLATPGEATGILVLWSPGRKRLRPGEKVVLLVEKDCDELKDFFITNMENIVGLVVHTSGMLSHTSVVAREHKIPTIVQTADFEAMSKEVGKNVKLVATPTLSYLAKVTG